jgi:hypothetical protein
MQIQDKANGSNLYTLGVRTVVTMCKMLGEYQMHSEQSGEEKFSSPCEVSNCLSSNLVMALSVQVIKKKGGNT